MQLPENAVNVSSVFQFAGVSAVAGDPTVSSTIYTVQTSAPASGTEVQFTGSADDPSSTLTFSGALTAGGLLVVQYTQEGAL